MVQTRRLDQRLATIPATIWEEIAKIDELKGQWIGAANLSPYILGRLKRSVLITSTGASTRIEGAQLEDTDVEKLMQGLVVHKFRDRDVQEVKGYYELLSKVFDAWETIKLTEGSIQHLHQELLKYVERAQHYRGKYKIKENTVQMIDAEGNVIGTVFKTTPVYLASIEMQELVEWTQAALAEKKYHPLLVIGNFIVQFLSIHPFEDGNGRLSRILTNLLMLQVGYAYMPYVSHEKLVEDNKVDYYLALQKTQKIFHKESEDITPWLEFFLSVIRTQSQLAIDLLSKESVEQILSPKQLVVWEYLQKVSEAAPGEIAKETGVARPTVAQVLDKLMDLKKVERIGQGTSSTIRYRKL